MTIGLSRAVFVLFVVAATFAQAHAQGTTGSINGTVADSTGAVLPGVTITASGPALMGAQTAITNDQGQYRFPALPPGIYRIQYELSGFTTVVRENIVVNIGFTATLNVQLQVATLAETVTVTGASPVVDTQNTNIQTNFTLEMIKSLPNARDIWALIAVAPGTTMSSYDVGGSRAGTQTGYQAYGRGGQVRVQVDGANATEDTDGTGYFNYGAFEEVQIGTDSNDASMPTPGVQINAVVKSGGNSFRGDLYVDFMNQNMQGSNVTDEQRRNGAGEGDRITRYYDPNIGIGGPIRRDKFWYFFSGRNQRSGRTVTGFPADNPAPEDFLTKLENFTDKLTYQINPNNKVSQFFEIRRKLQPIRDASSTRYLDAVFKQESMSSYGSVQWDSVVSRTFFFTTRLGSWGYNWPNYAYGTGGLGRDIQRRRDEPNSTGNFAGGARENKTYRRRWQLDWAGTYFKDAWLGGNHTLRTGFTWERETERILDNGFLDEVQERFDSPASAPFTVPWRVIIENSPREATNNLAHSGAYIQDQLVINRHLTVNAGVRWDYYRVHYPEHEIMAAPFRDFFYAGAPLPGNGYVIPPSFPNFRTPGNDAVIRFPAGFGPRAGIAYDIRGDGKTVIKANWGRYQANPGPQNFTNPNQRIQYTFQWQDVNGDRRYQVGEERAFVSSSGGVRDTISPDLKQEYTDDMSVFIEREIMTDLGIRAGYVKKMGNNNWQSVETGRQYAGYTDRRTFNDAGPDGLLGTPDDGTPFVVFDYPAGVTIPASRTDLRNQPGLESWDQNIDLTINKRMSNRWSLLSSFLYNWDHAQRIRPGTGDRELGLPDNPNQERFNETDLTRFSFKLFGTYQAPWNIYINPVFRYQEGVNLARVVRVTLRTGSFDYEAESPDSYRSDNVPIFDLMGERKFQFGSRAVDLFAAAFNLFNANPATTQDELVGRRTAVVDGQSVPYARFLRPSVVLPPRVFRIGARLSF